LAPLAPLAPLPPTPFPNTLWWEATMSRTLALLTLGALVAVTAGSARADVAPPKGFKRVTLDHKITTEKEYPDYVFFTVLGGANKFAKLPSGITEVKLDPKTPIVIPGADRGAGIGRQGHIVAVPKDAAKNYKTEKEFHEAIRAGKVEGMVRGKTQLDSQTTVKDNDDRKVVVREHKLEIDAKGGIILTPKKDDGGKNAPEEELDEGLPTAYTPRGGLWVAGMIASLGILLAGLWLVTRCRSHRGG
jgi:hypothetical protein